MRRGTLWTWISAAALGVGLASTAGADPGDRDRESGRMRMQDLQQRVAQRESVVRPDLDRSITGREMGRDTITLGQVGREFSDRNQMMGGMTSQTSIRASATSQATGDASGGNNDGKAYPNAGRSVSARNAVATRMREDANVGKRVEPSDAQTAREKEITNKSVTGKPIGRDTISVGDSQRNFKDQNEMMGQLNMQTKMRADRTLAARGGPEGSDRAYPNAGRDTTSNPALLTDNARAGLARLGFAGAAKREKSSDIEDKAR